MADRGHNNNQHQMKVNLEDTVCYCSSSVSELKKEFNSVTWNCDAENVSFLSSQAISTPQIIHIDPVFKLMENLSMNYIFLKAFEDGTEIQSMKNTSIKSPK